MKKDFSKCQCPQAGWCDLLKKEMTATPPNWQWCQSLTPKEREDYYKKVNGKVRTLRQAIKRGWVDTINFVDELPERNSGFAVCVIPATDDMLELMEITRPSMMAYAEKCGADYIELEGNQHKDWPMANKYRVHSVSSVYEKTLYLDCDIVIRDNAPNIFELTPDDKLSIFEEFSHWTGRNFTDWIQREQDTIVRKFLKPEERDRWLVNGAFTATKMLNGGVMVIPKCVADWYSQPDRNYIRQWCFDQNYLSLILPDELHHQLDERFNFNWQKFDFTYVHQHSNFLNIAKDCYFIHVNGEKNLELRKRMLSWDYSDPVKNKLLLHEDVSTNQRWNGCSISIKNQLQLNEEICDYVTSQPEERLCSIDDVKIACIGHSQEQFDRIQDKPYIIKLNINGFKSGEFSDNVWAETRVWGADKKVFPNNTKIIGYTTASWQKKYTSQKIDEFENWPGTDILLKSKPEDKIWLCADMYCSCLWLRSREEYGRWFYGIIGDCMGEQSAQDMLRKYLKLIGLSSKTIMHKSIPFSNQMIGYRENIDQYEKWLLDEDVFGKCQYVLEKYGFAENKWEYRGITDDKHEAKWKGRCYSFRPQAYLMEATNCFWCAHQDFKYIGCTHRLNEWYNHDVRTVRGW